jgi:hypothetical protein
MVTNDDDASRWDRGIKSPRRVREDDLSSTGSDDRSYRVYYLMCAVAFVEVDSTSDESDIHTVNDD